MNDFNPESYGPEFAPLLSIERQRALDAGLSDRAWRDQLDPLTVEQAFEHTQVGDEQMAHCCLAGVWLLHDFLEVSHAISQDISTPEGSFWHGIMHRREGDFSNAKYWFRNAGDHPVFEQLSENLADWDPFDFVDRCQRALETGADHEACLAAQQQEWQCLFDWCYHRAVQ